MIILYHTGNKLATTNCEVSAICSTEISPVNANLVPALSRIFHYTKRHGQCYVRAAYFLLFLIEYALIFINCFREPGLHICCAYREGSLARHTLQSEHLPNFLICRFRFIIPILFCRIIAGSSLIELFQKPVSKRSCVLGFALPNASSVPFSTVTVTGMSHFL